MDAKSLRIEEENNQKGLLTSLVLHLILAALMFFMPMTSGHYEHKESRIQVELPQDMLGGGAALGLPDQGQGKEPSPGKPDPNAGNGASSPEPEPEPEPIAPAPTPIKPVISKPKPAPVATPAPPKQTTEDPNAVALRRQQEEVRRKADEEKYRQQQADRAKRQAEEAARAEETRRQAEAAERARAEQAAKDKFKNRFPGTGGAGNNGTGTQAGNNGGGGTGTGRGNTGRPGNQGNPDGDPNSDNLTGIGRGPGRVDGFGSREVRSAPRLQENSQKSGRIVIDICVNADGNVISTRFNAGKSSTLDDELQDAAIRNARQYKFAAGGAEKQCGSITYNFIVK